MNSLSLLLLQSPKFEDFQSLLAQPLMAHGFSVQLHWLSFFFVNLTQPRVSWEDDSHLSNDLYPIGLWACLWGTFLIDELCGMVQPPVGSAIPGQVILQCLRMHGGQTLESKRVSFGSFGIPALPPQ